VEEEQMRCIFLSLLCLFLTPCAEPQESLVKGEKNSAVTILEFSDFECPFSAKAAPLINELIRANPGKVRLVFKNSPLPFHQHSVLAHEAALASAVQGKFWEMHDLLFANQTKLTLDDVVRYATQLKLDVPGFRQALESHRYLPLIEADEEEARGLGVAGTPTFFINGKKIVGAQGLDTFESALDEALGRPRKNPNPKSPSVPAFVPAASIMTAGAPTRGPAQAPITIVEFSDFQCPFCRSAIPALQDLMQQYPGDVRWVFKHYPLEFHPDSLLAHKAALAAGEQGKFWDMHDLVFGNQGAIKRDDLLRRAQQLGLEMNRFVADLDSDKFQKVIDEDKAEGSRLGVTGTPTLFVNGKRMIGARSLSEYKEVIDAALSPNSRAPIPPSQPSTSANVKENAPNRGSVLNPDIPMKGSHNSPVTITWFTDLESPLSPAAARLLWQLRADYPGKIRVVFKSLPMEFHLHASLAHEAMLCAGAQGKFWEMQQLILANPNKLTRDDLIADAKTLGLNQTKFIAALDSRLYQPILDEDAQEARRRGVYGVPVFFINEKRLDGIQPLELFRDTVNAELAKPQTLARGQ
jgi:protein-disulfide isomerase